MSIKGFTVAVLQQIIDGSKKPNADLHSNFIKESSTNQVGDDLIYLSISEAVIRSLLDNNLLSGEWSKDEPFAPHIGYIWVKPVTSPNPPMVTDEEVKAWDGNQYVDATPALAAKGYHYLHGDCEPINLPDVIIYSENNAGYNKGDFVEKDGLIYESITNNNHVSPNTVDQNDFSANWEDGLTNEEFKALFTVDVCNISKVIADFSGEGGKYGNVNITLNGLYDALWNTVKQYFPKGITVDDSDKTLIPALKSPIYYDGDDIALKIDKGLAVSGGKLNANIKSPLVFDPDGKVSWEDTLGSNGQVWAKDGDKYKPVNIVIGTGNSGGTPPYLSAGSPKIQLPGLVDPNGKIWVQAANAWKTPYYGTPTNYQPQINSLAARVSALENAPSSSGVSALTGCTVLGGRQFQNPINSVLWAYCGSSNNGQRPLGYDSTEQNFYIARIK